MWDCGHVGASFLAGLQAHIQKQNPRQDRVCVSRFLVIYFWLVFDMKISFEKAHMKKTDGHKRISHRTKKVNSKYTSASRVFREASFVSAPPMDSYSARGKISVL